MLATCRLCDLGEGKSIRGSSNYEFSSNQISWGENQQGRLAATLLD